MAMTELLLGSGSVMACGCLEVRMYGSHYYPLTTLYVTIVTI